MEIVELENRKNRKIKKYMAFTFIISGLFIFYLCSTGFITELTGGYQTILINLFGKTNKWSGSYGPENFVNIMDDFTTFAGQLFISIFSLIFGGYLFIRKKFRYLYTYFFVVIGAGIFLVFLKNYYGGEPWYNWFNIFKNDRKSFPSGHAMMSVVFYFTMARLIYRTNADKKLNRYFVTISFLICFIIGICLLIIGVHSPTEIIAGWSIGCAWISAAWLIDHYIRKKIYYRHHAKETELTEV